MVGPATCRSGQHAACILMDALVWFSFFLSFWKVESFPLTQGFLLCLFPQFLPSNHLCIPLAVVLPGGVRLCVSYVMFSQRAV